MTYGRAIEMEMVEDVQLGEQRSPLELIHTLLKILTGKIPITLDCNQEWNTQELLILPLISIVKDL